MASLLCEPFGLVTQIRFWADRFDHSLVARPWILRVRSRVGGGVGTQTKLTRRIDT